MDKDAIQQLLNDALAVRAANEQLIKSLQALLPTAADPLGELAHRHLLVLESTGHLTIADSRELRHEVLGEDIHSTANLFGKKGDGAMFYRLVPYGERTKPDQQVRLNATALQRAKAYRQAHGLDLGTVA